MDLPALLELLTPPEKEILDLVSQGYSYDQMRQTIYISKSGIDHHVHGIISHLGIPRGGMVRVVALACETHYFTELLDISPPAKPLLPSEHLAVHYVSLGYTAQEDGQTRNVHPVEVARQRRHARQKLGALTLPHLVRCSYQLGILPFDTHYRRR